MRAGSYKYFQNLNRADSIAMTFFYVMKIAQSVASTFVLWLPDCYLWESEFFPLFYSIGNGVAIVIAIILVSSSLSSRRILRTRVYLIIAVLVEVITMVADVVVSIAFNSFWTDRYLYLIYRAVMVTMLMRRLVIISFMEKMLSEITEARG